MIYNKYQVLIHVSISGFGHRYYTKKSGQVQACPGKQRRGLFYFIIVQVKITVEEILDTLALMKEYEKECACEFPDEMEGSLSNYAALDFAFGIVLHVCELKQTVVIPIDFD